ncbi:MAG: Gldg family protein [Clostridia bacterium]|nr:Gldg family protein [Clostridia bacterium]
MNGFSNKLKGLFATEGAFRTAMTALIIALAVVLNLLIYLLTTTLGLYFYTIEQVDLTISGSTDALFASAIEDERRVSILFCQSRDEVLANGNGAYVLSTAEQYAERYPDLISLEFINIITKRDSKGNRVDLNKYTTDINGNETPIYSTSVIFASEGGSHIVLNDDYTSDGYAPFFTLVPSSSGFTATSYNGEEVIAAMVCYALTPAAEHEVVYFTQYHGESADPALYTILTCAGYTTEMIDLRSTDIPKNAAMVYISAPVKDFERAAEGSGIVTEIERLEEYMARGGVVFAAIDPYSVSKLPVLTNFLKEQGITVATTEDTEGKVLPALVRESGSAITADGFTLVAEYAQSDAAESIYGRISDFGGRVIIKSVAALTLDAGSNAQPILKSSGGSVLQSGGKTVNSDGGYCIAATSTVENEPSESNADGKDGKLFVVPSIYLTAADALIANGYSNKDFVYSVFEEIAATKNIPYNCNTVVYDTQTLENLSMGTARLYTALIMAIPAAIAVVGAVVIIKRKNR